jgi:two-component system, OmpR family, response regulator
MPEPSREFSSGAVVPSIAIFQPANGPRDAVQAAISQQGWTCVTLPAPITGMRSWLEVQYDALLVAPFSGWEEPAHLIGLARAIAGARLLVVLTADASVDQRLVALHAGADDALWCNADPRELLARIGGLLRRQRLASGWLECAELCIDLIDRRVTRLGRSIALPLREFDLLTRLARVPDRIVAREALWRAVWKIDFDPGTNRIEVHMSRLRAKVDRGFDWPMLMTARGHGYGLRSSSSAARQVGRA